MARDVSKVATRELPVISYKGRTRKDKRTGEEKYYKAFSEKSEQVQTLIREALYIVKMLGIPLDGLTDIKKEKIAMALLAVGDVQTSSGWSKIKDANKDYSVTTKQMVRFYIQYLEATMSEGSYDYVLRDGLKSLLIAGIVVQSKPDANISDSTRGYKISVEFSRIIKKFGQKDWEKQVATFNESHPTYAERLSQKRALPKLRVTTPDGKQVELKDGDHNAIQKQVIEEFLAIFGYDAVVLYCGDADNKYGVIFEEERLLELGFGDLRQGKLPDIIAHSQQKDWIFMIEAYHTSNPITAERKCELEQLMGSGVSKAVFVTAFENSAAFKSCTEDLAWETEVWIATDPDHMIHRNGSRFMGPYKKSD